MQVESFLCSTPATTFTRPRGIRGRLITESLSVRQWDCKSDFWIQQCKFRLLAYTASMWYVLIVKGARDYSVLLLLQISKGFEQQEGSSEVIPKLTPIFCSWLYCRYVHLFCMTLVWLCFVYYSMSFKDIISQYGWLDLDSSLKTWSLGCQAWWVTH